MSGKPDEVRDGVNLTNLDQPLFDGADATKRDLVDYLDAVHSRIIPALEDRPLSVKRLARPARWSITSGSADGPNPDDR